jgi:hypothetical protein
MKHAIVQEITRPPLPDLLLGPGFGKWHATPRGDGRFGVRKLGVGVAIVSGRFETEEAARGEAAALNEGRVS